MGTSVHMAPCAQELCTSGDACMAGDWQKQDSVVVKDLSFSLNGTPILHGINLSLKRGDRCLLVGANGAGKSTFLKVVAGKHLVPKDSIRVLNKQAFHDTTLNQQLAYLGGSWVREVPFAGYAVPMTADMSPEEMIRNNPDVDPVRCARLQKVLDLNMKWRLHQLSDGQRRRVQIFIGLLYPFEVLLLDEITVDLDVVGRQDLLDFLKADCEERGATMIYATHIFDGLEDWATHLAYITKGTMPVFKLIDEVEELNERRMGGAKQCAAPLFRTVEHWLREEKRVRENDEKALGKENMELKTVDIFYKRHYQGVGGGMAGNYVTGH